MTTDLGDSLGTEGSESWYKEAFDGGPLEFLPGQEQCTKPALVFFGVKLVSNLAGWFVSIGFTLLLFSHVTPCKANLGGRPLLPGQATVYLLAFP